MKIRGGIRIGALWEAWPSAQLCFGPEGIVLRYRGEHSIKKEDLEMLSFLRGTFLTEIRIEHRSADADSPIRFFPMFAKDVFSFVTECGLPCEERKAPFYTPGDLVE